MPPTESDETALPSATDPPAYPAADEETGRDPGAASSGRWTRVIVLGIVVVLVAVVVVLHLTGVLGPGSH